MKELMEKLICLGEVFGVMGRIGGGVRSWVKMLGVGKENLEEMIKRVLVGNGMNFNYIEEGVEGLCSEVMWSWVRDGYKREGLEKFNMVEKRLELYDRLIKWLDKMVRIKKLSEWVKEDMFWYGLWKVYGCDVVMKRVRLSRMMLKDEGIEVSDNDGDEIVVDYNILGVMKYIGVIDYKGGFKDRKEEVDRMRVKVYKVMKELLEEGKEEELNGSWIDGLMFWIGRELRKRGLVDVCLWKGCIDY